MSLQADGRTQTQRHIPLNIPRIPDLRNVNHQPLLCAGAQNLSKPLATWAIRPWEGGITAKILIVYEPKLYVVNKQCTSRVLNQNQSHGKCSTFRLKV